MTWREIEQKLTLWKPVVRLDKLVSHSTRKVIQKATLFLVVVTFVLAAGLIFPTNDKFTSLFFFVLLVFLVFFLAECFFYSSVFQKAQGGVDFGYELASMVYAVDRGDITKGFIKSDYGSIILVRLGVSRDTAEEFLSRRQVRVNVDRISFPSKGSILESFLTGIFSADQEFKTFLFAHNVTEEIFLNCGLWIFSSMRSILDRERWWSENFLSNIQPIGRAWSYGKAYFLNRFSFPLRVTIPPEVEYHKNDALALETILAKSREANALIAGEEGVGKIEVIETLLRSIEQGKSAPALNDKKFLVFDTAAFISEMADKDIFERAILKIFSDAAQAGNIVLIIPEFPALVKDAGTLGSDLPSLIDRFLASSAIQVIAISSTSDFHSVIEINQALMQRFNVLIIKGGSATEVLTILEKSILELEASEGVFFTYQTIYEAVRSAERFYVGSPILEKSLDLMAEAVAKAREEGRVVIYPEDVLSLVSSETGVPTGEISKEEQLKLKNLESLLHERIIGQNEAIFAIANSLRRARAGIANPNRPIGSFLFLGPTGVGKTETTKALAEIFFGAEAKILRLDMSEYNTRDGLNRLIGTLSGEPGMLATLLRENPYGVLLLDEFEKTESRAMDLFLQILDEGLFSDALGRKVSARNVIIVATSNAGSDLIFEAMQKGERLENRKDEIVNEVVQRGIYRPELLNRFDGIILFHPLDSNHLREVAKLQLKRLAWRLKSQGITFEVTDALIEFLVNKGLDPKFGARSLNRAVQETVEKVIADKIIAGELRPGSTASLSVTDLQ